MRIREQDKAPASGQWNMWMGVGIGVAVVAALGIAYVLLSGGEESSDKRKGEEAGKVRQTSGQVPSSRKRAAWHTIAARASTVPRSGPQPIQRDVVLPWLSVGPHCTGER